MRGSRGVLIACVAVVVVCIVALSATRDGSPPATPEAIGAMGTPPVASAPAGCDVPPRPMSFLETLVDAPEPDVTPAPIRGVPDGPSVDPATRTEVAEVVATLIACTNAGDLLRAFALYEDGYLRRLYDQDGVMSAEIAHELVVSFATPEPVSSDRRWVLVGLPVSRLMDDGRVAVVIETNGGAEDEDEDTELGLLVLSRAADGRWLVVDGRAGLDRDELPAA